jgi:tripartite ATP-independent transporter DctP family solute receptor
MRAPRRLKRLFVGRLINPALFQAGFASSTKWFRRPEMPVSRAACENGAVGPKLRLRPGKPAGEVKTMKNMTRRGLLGAASAARASTFLGKPARAAEFEFKLGVNTPDAHPLTVRLTEAAHAIGEQSSGRLTVTVFPNSQLGGDPEMLSQLRAGGIELLAAPSMTLSTLVPLSGLPSIGFAFQSYDQVWAAMDGGVGDIVRDAIGNAGIVPMRKKWDNGFRQITSSSSRQLNGVEDLRGFKIRVPVTALLTSLFSGLGALPSSISYSELYSALQTHIVEGQENPLAQVSTGKLYECRNTARCRTIAGAAIGSSPTAGRCRACRPTCSKSSTTILTQPPSRSAPICWKWIARCRRS